MTSTSEWMTQITWTQRPYKSLIPTLQMCAGNCRDSAGVFYNICRENPVMYTDFPFNPCNPVNITGFSLQILQKPPRRVPVNTCKHLQCTWIGHKTKQASLTKLFPVYQNKHWTVKRSFHWPIVKPYYIEDCRIFGVRSFKKLNCIFFSIVYLQIMEVRRRRCLFL